MTLNLPEPIAAYFAADTQDAEAVARCFTPNAVVKDEGRTHAGLDAIKRWKAEASTKYQHTSELLTSAPRGAVNVVTCRLTGNFPGSPVDLRFAFALEGNKISSLEIAP